MAGNRVRNRVSRFDLEAARVETPGCGSVAHLNNAGAALPTTRTLNAVAAHLELEATMGGYEAADRAADAVAAVRSSAARLIGANLDEIALTTSDSMAWLKAFWGFVFGGGIARGQRVIVDRVFYSSHYLALLQARRVHGIEIVLAPSRPDATVDVDAFAALLHRDSAGVALVSITMVPTHCGVVNPVAEIGAMLRGHGAAYIVDACQAVGQMAVDVNEIGCDALTTTGRKWLRAPRGTGFLYTRRSFAERCDPPGIDGVSAVWNDADSYVLAHGAARFDEFESSIAARLGLGAAIDQLLEVGVDAVFERVQQLSGRLRRELAALGGVRVTETSAQRSGIVTFTVDGTDPTDIVTAARTAGVNINASRPTWSRLDADFAQLAGVVRASPHAYNTDDELDRLIAVVRDIASTSDRAPVGDTVRP